ncbi:MAG: ATP-binding cassette domain-containing protein [Lachnospiraceae bacterium]|nr:ATP-binding cassette domain-containing protein [Lachnospiraceae bacterium]
MAEEKEVLLKVEHLCQYFGSVKAVDDVSFDIKKGEVFGLVGESGCGKTTTGRSIIKIYDITSGNIYFKGQRIGAGTKSYTDAIKAARKELAKGNPDAARKAELEKIIEDNKKEIESAKLTKKNCDKEFARSLVEKLSAQYEQDKAAAAGDAGKLAELEKKYKADVKVAKKSKLVTKIQMIFQDPIASLNPRMTVREIIAEGLIIRGIKDQEYIDSRVYDILERVGLVREHAGRYPHEFSGGQRQRIGIARSIVMEPDMLIADEPVSALDVSIQAQVINLLNDLRDELGLTILFIAHDLSVVKYFSDRIGVMYYGHMVELADSDELFRHPIHPYTRSLLSAIPLPDPHFEKQRVRIVYNPIADHDYSEQGPTFREIIPGHFVSCNDAEEAKYREEFGL